MEWASRISSRLSLRSSRFPPNLRYLGAGDGARRSAFRGAVGKGSFMAETWIDACAADAIDAEDVMRFDHAGRTYALYRAADGRYFATDGLCTHEEAHLAEGFVIGEIIECPMHNGRFDFTTGAAKGAPVCVDLATYPVKVEGGRLFLRLS